uniref:carboxylate--amine ligase n=1 Tax=Marinobacterium profundum TaxID=1714300 RepID=UPI000AA8BF7E|nr:carboxylate--amine ligase [Marinobacterium profundum]
MKDTQDKIIILGTDTQIGLSLIREFGRRNCHVVAIGRSKGSIGLRSRYVQEGFLWPRGTEAEQIEFLNRIARITGARFLLCVSETDILFLNRCRDRLDGLTPLIPSKDTIARVLDKQGTACVAAEAGILSPESHTIKDLTELPTLARSLIYPVILKWSNPHEVMQDSQRLGLAIEKIIYCHNAEELAKQLRRYVPLGQFPMIQAYCPGYGLGQFFFMHRGKALLRFQHRRIHEWPPEGGFSSLCAGVPLEQHRALQDKSIALLQKLDWEGPAMVEYRYDEHNDRAVLMEINGRFWGSLPLAYHSNAPFGWYSYQVLGLGKVPSTLEPMRDDIQCRNTLIELKRLLRILFQPHKIRDKSLRFSPFKEVVGFIGGYFNPKMRYYIFSLSDPKPLLADWAAIARKLMRR